MQQPNYGYPVQAGYGVANQGYPNASSNYAPPMGQAGHVPGPPPGQPPNQKTSNKMGIVICSFGIIISIALTIFYWVDFNELNGFDWIEDHIEFGKCWSNNTLFPVSNDFYKCENDNRGNALIFHGETMNFNFGIIQPDICIIQYDSYSMIRQHIF